MRAATSAAHDRQHGRALGWALLRGCAGRDDFYDLDLLLDEGEWAGDLLRGRDAAPIVARVVAQRGGNVERDLQACRRRSLPLHSLNAALAAPARLEGALVLMRGRAVQWRSDEQRRAHAVELIETRRILDEERSVETGANILAAVPRELVLEPSAEYVLLLRFDGEREVPGAASPSDVGSAAVATVLASFEADDNDVAWR